MWGQKVTLGTAIFTDMDVFERMRLISLLLGGSVDRSLPGFFYATDFGALRS